jgi:Secretion system C-terminal sorting domain
MKIQFLICCLLLGVIQSKAQTPVVDSSKPAQMSIDVTDKMKIYPNPASSWAFINHTSSTAKDAAIKVFDWTGALVMTATVRLNTIQTIINTSRLRAGNYLLTYVNGKEMGTLKFRKE